jgi:rod shape-determining protein MreC
MFSRKMVVAIGLIVAVVVNLILLIVTAKYRDSSQPPSSFPITVVAPLQGFATHTLHTTRDIWRHYFYLISIAKENDRLKQELSYHQESQVSCSETELANHRLRELLHFRNSVPGKMIPAEVIGRDPSPWLETIMIDKGTRDSVVKGLPVVVPQGIVGQVVKTTDHDAQILMILDKNSSVDALVQRTRSRGIIRGDIKGTCSFDFVLRKEDIEIGDRVITSGFDGVYPKGLAIGRISTVIKPNSGIFQDISVLPYVDFEKLEEVFVVLPQDRPSNDVYGR